MILFLKKLAVFHLKLNAGTNLKVQSMKGKIYFLSKLEKSFLNRFTELAMCFIYAFRSSVEDFIDVGFFFLFRGKVLLYSPG